MSTDPSPHPDGSAGTRLRFAPSPTGYLHVGGARTALHNWLFARSTGGRFLLRIEDTDKARSTDESTRAIFDGLRWLGLDWDEEVVFQGANVDRHRTDAYRLLQSGAAYRDFTPADELEAMRREAESRGETFVFDRRIAEYSPDEVRRRLERGDPYTIRFRVPPGTTSWDDLVHGTISFDNRDLDDFIILRSDGTPIYNLAVVSDDIAMAITVVMRGDDHISNTPKQILLYQALGAPLPRFAHIPSVLGSDGRKLSKRHGATALGDYAGLGFLPDAMRNFLALLGWSPGGDREIMTTAELIELFDPGGLLPKASVFDIRKLEWMNGQHMSRMPLADLDQLVRPFIIDAGLASGDELSGRSGWMELLELLRVRGRTLVEVARLAEPYLRDTITFDEAAVAKHWKDGAATGSLLAEVAAVLETSEWTAAALESRLRDLAASLGVGTGKLFQPLRVALTGLAESPGIFDVLLVLGRDRSLARLRSAIGMLGGR